MHIPQNLVILYLTTSILVRTRIVYHIAILELPELSDYNSGTRFYFRILLQFWDVTKFAMDYSPIPGWMMLFAANYA